MLLDNSTATKESGEPMHSVVGNAGGASVWAAFVAPTDGDYTFTAKGMSAGSGAKGDADDEEDSPLDTQLAVYTGDKLSGLNLVAANDDVDAGEFDFSSRVAFRAVKGTTYRIAVDTQYGAKGTIQLEWKEGREDVASPVGYDVFYDGEAKARNIQIKSTADWFVVDCSDWIEITKGTGHDGECIEFLTPELSAETYRTGMILVQAGEGSYSTIKITQSPAKWYTDKDEAFEAAQALGKRVFMVCGRDSCPNTTYVRLTACESDVAKPILSSEYVLWYCDCDKQEPDYCDYTDGLGSYTLPLICIVNPESRNKYVGRRTGFTTADELAEFLTSHSEGTLPSMPPSVMTSNDVSGVLFKWGNARRAQTYEVWRGEQWNPGVAECIGDMISDTEFFDTSVVPGILYYYRVRAVNAVGMGEFSGAVVGCCRNNENGEMSLAIGDALGAPHLDWATEGDYPWTVQGTNTYDGVTAMQSAFVDPKESGVTSVLKTTVTGPTKMSFRYKTRMYSSRFTVKIDGTEKFLVRDAVSDWTLGVVEIPAGSHEIEFSYAKGGYYTSGFNGVYLDSVQFDVVSDPPSLSPATTDDEESAQTFTGSMAVSIDAPAGSAIYYTLDGSEPSLASQRYEGTFSITASTRVKAMCVQDGYDCSATVSGLYLERHPVQAGEWTTDVEGAKKAALKSGSIIVTLLANYDTCYYSQLFKEVSESAEFLSWARANGVYLITADSSRAVDTGAAYNRFWDLFYDAGQSGSAYYPALAIANAWEPDKVTGYALARSGQNIGTVTYDGTATTLESGLRSFFVARPPNSYVWIEFDGNGGTPYERSRVGISGQTVGELPSAYRPYHYFKGWFTLADGGAEVSEGTVLNGDAVYYAYWTPYSYRIRFDANGGSVAPTYKYVYYGAEYGDLPTPVRTGNGKEYTFDGWFTKSNGGDRVTSDTQVAITAEQMLYAHWTERIMTYPVTYSPGAQGAGVLATDIKVHDVALPLNGVMFVRDGYTQTGWSIIDGGDMVYDLNATYTKNAALALYPYWTQNKMTVTFNSNGGAVVVPDTKDYVPGQTLGQLPVPTRRGYTLQGWWTSSSGGAQVAESTIVSSNATYYAHWTPIGYSIQYDPNGGEGEMDDQSMVYDVVEPLSAIQFAKSGSMFRGWSLVADGAADYSDCACVSNLTAVADDVVTLYAVWQEKPVPVMVCEDAFGVVGTVTLDDSDNIVVTLTNNVSGTVEIPDSVGAVTIDLNGHNMVGDGGPAIRVVKDDGEGATTRLAIVDTSEGEKGQIAGDGESAGIEFADDAKPGVRLDVEDDVFVLNGDGSEQPWRELCPVEATLVVGEYFKATLAELGYDVPTDGVTPYSVVAKGLPAGLQLKYNAAVTKKVKQGKTTKTVVMKPAKVEWWIEGVPTAAVDFFTNPPYLVITANGATTTEPLPVEVFAQNVTDLGELALGETVNEQYYLPGVTSGWVVSGLPTGLKYTAKMLTTSKKVGKKTVVTTNALPYSVYGMTTKAGLFTITAKKKVGAFYETKKYRVLVTPKAVDEAVFGDELADINSMAYDEVDWNLLEGGHVGRLSLPALGTIDKVAGLPTGLAFAAKDTYAYTNAKKKTGKYLKQYGQTIVGTPTKPGTYVVTFTKNVTTGTGKNKKTVAKTAQILWTVTANDANLELGFNTVGGVIEGGTVGLKYGDLMAFSATDGATVTASGMPAGITLANLGDGSYAFRGFTTKTGTYLVTVKATLNGKTVAQRVALKVDALPAWAKGTFNGYIAGADGATNGLATITVSSVGKLSGKFYDRGTNWTFTAASYTGYDNAAPAYSVPVVAKYSYKEKEKVKVKGKWTTKTVTKSVARNFTLKVGQDALGGVATLEEVDGSTVEAWQNLWGQAGYKALGKRLFSTKSGKNTLAYKTFVYDVCTNELGQVLYVTGESDKTGLTHMLTLSLKVTTAGAVTATMSFDTGKTKKDAKTKKTVKVVYKATCSTVVIPLSAADNEEFEGEVYLYFAPSPANHFPGFAGAAQL